MTYNTNIFLLIFLPLTLLFYYILPKKARWGVLLAASIIFYLSSSGRLIAFLAITTVAVYLSALLMQRINDSFKKQKSKEGITKDEKKQLKAAAQRKKKLVVLGAVVINFGILFTLKYFNFFAEGINGLLGLMNVQPIPHIDFMLPLGISFYTLQAMSYVIDVYRGTCKADRNFGRVALFMCFFPQIVEGPIGRYGKLADQLYEGHAFDYEKFMHGLQLVLWGLIKLFVVADRANIFVSALFGDPSRASGAVVVLGMLFYTVQIYADFSGCMDVVTGVAQMFGISLEQNFARPFFSRSVNEFWRRWHITLGAWLRDYIFYPISLSKFFAKLSTKAKKHCNEFFAKTLPVAFALFFVWFGNGIWHGADIKYIVYGLYYYLIMMIATLCKPLTDKFINALHIKVESKGYKLWQMFRTFLFVNVGMLIFRAESLNQAGLMFSKIFACFNIATLWNGKLYSYSLSLQDLYIVIVFCFVMLVVGFLQEKGYKLREEISKRNIVLRWSIYFLALFALIIFGAYGEGYRAADFIYAQF